MKKLILIASFLGIAFVNAQETSNTKTNSAQEEKCPKMRPILGLCHTLLEPEDEGGERSYIAGIKKAACVLPTDSKEEEGRKVREMWDKYEDKLVCDSLFFPVIGGNIIKATVYKGNKDFFAKLIEWKVNLNRVDIDNRTVMDYIDDQLKKETREAIISELKYFQRHLKHYGAKRKSEL